MGRGLWVDLGSVIELKKKRLQEVRLGDTPVALTFKDGVFSAVSGECNHEKGPLGKGRTDGEYIICPWHGWTFHRKTGHGKHPFEAACLPRYALKDSRGHLFINTKPMNRRAEYPHPPHPLSRRITRGDGPIRVAGISTTAMSKSLPRYSTSEDLLETALKHARTRLRAETKLIKLRDLKFHHCGGFYSIDERACTWPCSFTQMDQKDQMTEIYEALVFWADVVVVATPVRWGSASSLYYKMAERLNCVENQSLIAGKDLIKDKTAAFILTGGQDNIQAVAGTMMMFFGELGFAFADRPFTAHSRGWEAEDMANNVDYVKSNKVLKQDVRRLIERTVAMSRRILKKKI
ncbi:MAG TPA: NAD(P)H-dependent oxidoreductase [Candidatus Omnitrophota bacterium]|nr:NAD(P)H-dependent oxidoreductase [Candidatus Omnitrophota bacterium]